MMSLKGRYIICLYVCFCFDVLVNSNYCGQIGKGFDILWDCCSRLWCHLKSFFFCSNTAYMYISYYYIPKKLLRSLYIAENIEYLRNRSALAVSCWVIILCLEVSCKADQIMSAQRE